MKIPEVSDVEILFPSNYKKLLPAWDEIGDDEKRGIGSYYKAVSNLFFSGGRLSDYGLKVRGEFDADLVYRYIRATLGDFGPSHEHKIGGIAHMLKQWCELTD